MDLVYSLWRSLVSFNYKSSEIFFSFVVDLFDPAIERYSQNLRVFIHIVNDSIFIVLIKAHTKFV